ncbi:two-component sensor histidine kinase [Streptomyces sp. A7024]|uniref:histidine kinase n=1 Tax=Streptomyces coryli TaxID=1128680 RepID=A0A6G4TSI2_9ACTN|nr:histidine kinase [Streptomyces coryli]NGN62814.1 two-component sensor histidine kinase [Streptomyces coryli]
MDRVISLPRPLRPALRAVTYTRWLHLFIGAVLAVVVAMVSPGLGNDTSLAHFALMLVTPVPLLAVAALIPAMRTAESVQVDLLLYPGDRPHPDIARSPSQSWGDKVRVFGWLVTRLWLGFVTVTVTVNGAAGVVGMLVPSVWDGLTAEPLGLHEHWQWWYRLLAPVAAVLVYAALWASGAAMAALAPKLLGPSPAERLAKLEERTERLLEHNRLARELHDTIGHALTVAVVQAGAARAAGSPEFTERALAAIEDTGREALNDLDRVLKVLREDAAPVSRRPTLADAGRLVESARGAGAEVRTDISGDLDAVPGPVSREGYRMLQECLTNVLRHAGPVPTTVRIAAGGGRLELEVRSKLPAESAAGTGGSGLRGIRERAELLGGAAECGPCDGEWRVRVELPIAG